MTAGCYLPISIFDHLFLALILRLFTNFYWDLHRCELFVISDLLNARVRIILCMTDLDNNIPPNSPAVRLSRSVVHIIIRICACAY